MQIRITRTMTLAYRWRISFLNCVEAELYRRLANNFNWERVAFGFETEKYFLTELLFICFNMCMLLSNKETCSIFSFVKCENFV